MIHADDMPFLAAGAVLDDLAPNELADYAAHRPSCPDCRQLEVELDHVLADLALVVPDRQPPPDLLDGIRLALAAESAAVGTAPSTVLPFRGPAMASAATATVETSARPRTRVPLVAALGLAAALVVAVVGLGGRAVQLESDLAAAGARVAVLEAALASDQDAVAVAAHPDRVSVALHGDALAPDAEAAVVFLPGTNQSFLVARNLPATPAGHGYQLWYADQAGVHPLQVLAWSGEGTLVAPIGVDLATSAAVMLTLEPDGGAQGEPGPQVVFGEL